MQRDSVERAASEVLWSEQRTISCREWLGWIELITDVLDDRRAQIVRGIVCGA